MMLGLKESGEKEFLMVKKKSKVTRKERRAFAPSQQPKGANLTAMLGLERIDEIVNGDAGLLEQTRKRTGL